jgi:hypothetical protein
MHTFWNAGPRPARLLDVIVPAGFERYFAELAEARDSGRHSELAPKYGLRLGPDADLQVPPEATWSLM